jgi:hypothetical protein
MIFITAKYLLRKHHFGLRWEWGTPHHRQKREDIRSRAQGLAKWVSRAFYVSFYRSLTLYSMRTAFWKIPNVANIKLIDLIIPVLIYS